MFGFFKKEKESPEMEPVPKTVLLSAIVSGTLIPISEVNDVVFSEKMMGDGFAILPNEEGTITSPVTGQVSSIFPSQHAISILLDNGLEVLVHLGINTVELNGKGFKTNVKEGDWVTPNTVLSIVDLDVLKAEGKDLAMIVIFTNMHMIQSFNLTKVGTVTNNDTIGTITMI